MQTMIAPATRKLRLLSSGHWNSSGLLLDSCWLLPSNETTQLLDFGRQETSNAVGAADDSDAELFWQPNPNLFGCCCLLYLASCTKWKENNSWVEIKISQVRWQFVFAGRLTRVTWIVFVISIAALTIRCSLAARSILQGAQKDSTSALRSPTEAHG